MSPKVDSYESVPAWSRDVRRNTSGVTYSRRSYYYDREFSDSIYRPSDDLERIPAAPENFTLNRRKGRQLQSASGAPLSEDYLADILARGRTFQSGGDRSNDPSPEYELPAYAPARPAQTDSITQPRPQPQVSAAANSETELDIADVISFARGIGIPTNMLDNFMMVYRGISDWEENGYENDDRGGRFAGLGLSLDPYHLEAGPPHQLRPLCRAAPRPTLPIQRTIAQRVLFAASSTAAAASAISMMNWFQGQTISTSSRATETQTQTQTRSMSSIPHNKKVCYYLIATVALGVMASFGLALWFASTRGDVSAGFTLGGYVIAVDALVAAVVGIIHSPRCQCWKGSAGE
ncbi:hypothetical protein HD806DRAFT_483628 [Xylariaceae sp. AK1471]|nr:hypothetical protein HD806DRAFT_483628 [Xylariaceae sp. AK1471]